MDLPQAVILAEGRAQANRLPDVVADRIRDLILTGELKDGERLPPLEALLSQFGVSAPTMREALRILEAEALIKVQRGSVGGAIVRRPTPQTAAYTLAMALRSHGTKKGDVATALFLLEPLCGMLCARLPNRKSTVVRELRKINAASRALIDGNELAFNETMTKFHAILVQRCGNDTLKLLTGALGSICMGDVHNWAESSAAHGRYPTGEELSSIEAHEKITDLIHAGEHLEVAALLTAHAETTRKYIYEAVNPGALVDPQAIRHNR
jgi:DNA-binding FadR family transcriptional regulator